MSKKQRITIAVIAIVSVFACVGMGLLRWGAVVYRLSDGERGWSIGAAIYQMLGWGAEAYREDFDWAYSLDDGEAEWTGPFGHGRFGHGFVRARLGRGFGRLVFLALLVGVGVFFCQRWRKARPASPVPGA